jgi:hypothetical protein
MHVCISFSKNSFVPNVTLVTARKTLLKSRYVTASSRAKCGMFFSPVSYVFCVCVRTVRLIVPIIRAIPS